MRFSKDWQYQSHLKPANCLNSEELSVLSEELRALAKCVFRDIPFYQCVSGTERGFVDKLITTARTPEGELIGFHSVHLMSVPGVGEVFHTGLVCVDPRYGNRGIAHQLLFRSLMRYFFDYRKATSTWLSNVSSLHSVLSVFANCCHDLYPSPTFVRPTDQHIAIGKYLAARSDEIIAIPKTVEFDCDRFVFVRGNAGSAFLEKAKEANKSYHKCDINARFYADHFNPNVGDAILQVGCISVWDLIVQYSKFFGGQVLKIRS